MKNQNETHSTVLEKLSGVAEIGSNVKALFEKLSDDYTKESVGRLLQGLGETLINLGHHVAGDEEEQQGEAKQADEASEESAPKNRNKKLSQNRNNSTPSQQQ